MTTLTARIPFIALALGGVAFIAGGITHPGDSGEGTKVEQLHEMLVQSSWYPAHLLLLLGWVGFALGTFGLRGRGSPNVQRVIRVVHVVAWVAVAGMAIHTLDALGADSIANGEPGFASRLATFNEIAFSAPWALGFATLAVVGGLTRTVGNTITAGIGLVGGVAFATAAATVPFTDRFDGLYPVGGLLGLWAVVIGVREAVAGTRQPDALVSR